jgi:hypothetical protein
VPVHQLPHSLGGVADMEQLADQRLDPARRPPLVTGEPVCQRPFPELLLQPGPLLRAQLLPRYRPFGLQGRGAAVLSGPPPPPHRPWHDPQIVCDLVDPIAAREPLGCLQLHPLAPLLLAGVYPVAPGSPGALPLINNPLEPHVHVIRAYGSSKPRRAVQECRIAGFLRAPVARR